MPILTEIEESMAIPTGMFYGTLDPELRAIRQARRDAAARRRARSLPWLIAAIMVERAAGHGACSEADLRCAGFTLVEIAQHRDAALKLARAA